MELDCLNGFPGPFIKFFLEKFPLMEIYKLCQQRDSFGATVICSYAVSGGKFGAKVMTFEGRVKGRIVEPQGDSKFGFDPVFLADGADKTFGRMTKEEKNKLSHRGNAFRKFASFMDEHIGMTQE